MASNIPFKTFIKEYAVVDIWGKLEPATVKIFGWKEDINVFFSSSERYPDSTNCQANFTNQAKMEFYQKGNPNSH